MIFPCMMPLYICRRGEARSPAREGQKLGLGPRQQCAIPMPTGVAFEDIPMIPH